MTPSKKVPLTPRRVDQVFAPLADPSEVSSNMPGSLFAAEGLTSSKEDRGGTAEISLQIDVASFNKSIHSTTERLAQIVSAACWCGSKATGRDGNGRPACEDHKFRAGMILRRVAAAPGRNDLCDCGSGLKYKNCCRRKK